MGESLKVWLIEEDFHRLMVEAEGVPAWRRGSWSDRWQSDCGVADSTILHRRVLDNRNMATRDDGIMEKVSIRWGELEGFLGKALPPEKENAGMMRGASDRTDDHS